jgi:hypothetical protein
MAKPFQLRRANLIAMQVNMFARMSLLPTSNASWGEIQKLPFFTIGRKSLERLGLSLV